MVEFETEISDDVLLWLLKIGNKYGFDPLSSEESEAYFVQLVREYNLQDDTEKAMLQKRLAKEFASCGKPPVWIQGAEWPFHKGKPMVFVGQIEAAVTRDGNHYPNVFYVFWNAEDGETVTVVQVD